MSDVYEIMMRIGVTESITGVLANLGQIFNKLDAQLAAINTKLSQFGRDIGVIGLGFTTFGAAGLLALDKLTEAGKQLTDQYTKMRAAGMSAVEMQNAMTAAKAAWVAVPGSDLAKNLELMIQLSGKMSADQARAIMPTVVAAGRTLEQLGISGGTEAIARYAEALQRRGLSSNQQVEAIQKFIQAEQATRGGIPIDQLMRAFSTGGAAMMGVSERFATEVLPFATMRAAAGGGGSRMNIGMLLSGEWQKEIAELEKEMRGGKHLDEWQRLGVRPDLDALRDPDKFAERLGQAMAQKGISDPTRVMAEFTALFGSRIAGLMSDLFLNSDFYKRMQQAQVTAPGATAAGVAGIAAQSPEEIEKVFRTTIQGVAATLGEAEAQIKADWEKSLLPFAESVRGWMAGVDPEALKTVMQVVTAFFLGLTAMGLVALAAALAPFIGAGGLLAGLAIAIGALVAANWQGLIDWMGRVKDALAQFFGGGATPLTPEQQKRANELNLAPGAGITPFQTGIGDVPDDMLAQLHQGEMVVPKDTADPLRNFLQLAGAGPGMFGGGDISAALGGFGFGGGGGGGGGGGWSGGGGAGGGWAPSGGRSQVSRTPNYGTSPMGHLAGADTAPWGGGIDRSQWLGQMTPAVVARMASMIQGEVGLGPRGNINKQIIELETLFNRAQSRGYRSITQDLFHGRGGYYASGSFPGVSGNQIEWFREHVLAPVLAGSDLGTQFLGVPPTGNASQMGFAGRRLAAGVYAAGRWWGDRPGRDEMFVQERDTAAHVDRLKRLPGHAPHWTTDDIGKALHGDGTVSQLQHQSWHVPRDKGEVTLHSALNIDGRELTRHVQRHQVAMAEHSRQSPSPDGRRMFTQPDHNYAT
jgi:hypothetical protein